MRWFALLFAIGLAVQGCTDGGEPRSFVSQCETQGYKQGAPEFMECNSKRHAAADRHREDTLADVDRRQALDRFSCCGWSGDTRARR